MSDPERTSEKGLECKLKKTLGARVIQESSSLPGRPSGLRNMSIKKNEETGKEETA